ncbi:peptide chain release factor N(5)-glutamine methyltransferase [Oxalobacteraceae bacterium OM1]|nr:peptide chain release factor N(5)-glutamine methyltransferase [Oxalobacteraceae bacterium OM1]
MPAPFIVTPGITLGALQRQAPLPSLETRILLSYALGLSRVQLITQDQRALTADEAQTVSSLFSRRLAGEPIAYLVGEREFFGLAFEVTPAVLIPRPETELLVELGVERLPHKGSALDMGTGSGAIAVALAHARRDAAVTALDVSDVALAVARRNAARHGVPVRFLQSDWYAALGDERFDVILSNPPYIRAGDRHLSEGDLRFEPAGALTDHADGLAALRVIIAGAPAHLLPRGWLLMEHGYDQAADVRALLSAQGFTEVQSWTDLAGIERATGGRLP